MTDLHGKLALVTGGAKGVGKIIARKLAERGAHVLINFFHSLDEAKQTKLELEALGAKVDLIRGSVAIEQQVDKMFDHIEKEYGYLDILVNNAASGTFTTLDEADDEAFDRSLNTNLKGSLWCARRAAKLMEKRGGGSIVNLSSTGSTQVAADYVTVGTSKAALESLTRYLAYEYGPYGIRVNTASANLLDNAVARRFPRFEEMRERIIAATPLGRIGTEEDLADLVLFLASDQSRFISGQMILTDGGMSSGGYILSPRNTEAAVAKALEAPADIQQDSTAADIQGETIAADTTTATEIEEEDGDAIAIVGMGMVAPGANDSEEFWQVLMDGKSMFRYIPSDRWENLSFFSNDASAEDKSYQNTSGFITDFVPARALQEEGGAELGSRELTTVWLRHSLYQALEGVKRRNTDKHSFVVGYTPDGNQNLEESMVINSTMHHLANVMGQVGGSAEEKKAFIEQASEVLEQEYARGALDVSELLSHRVGELAMQDILPEGTELLMVDTACSSSLYAIDIGMKGLLSGKHDIAVCGGSFALGPRSSVLFSKLHGLSTSGQVRPLDKAADGVLFSDGAGVVVLKRLSRAKSDGDNILAVVKAVGTSSDGKGKAIYAPSPDGQGIAIDRALLQQDVNLEDIDWVVAHATGTPAGDLTEFTSLREHLMSDKPICVTSNKSLIGHTGWAAGVISVIQVLLGLQKGLIPPQYQYESSPELFGVETSNLIIPKQPVAWKTQPDSRRNAAISGFGFGGTNAHMIVEEYKETDRYATKSASAPKERIAIVGWSAHVPGLSGDEQIEAWVKGQGAAPGVSFGEHYPLPPFQKVKMPPKTLRTLDRCQLMVLECSHQLRDKLGDFWEQHRRETGVILGHMGLTRHSTLYGMRCYLDDIKSKLGARVASRLTNSVLEQLEAEVKRLVVESNEDSFPGIMPNVIPARVANYFDLKGCNMAIDTGFESTFSAIEIASRYLRSGELTMALVGGVHGNTTPEMIQAMREHLNLPDLALAEGCFMFALVRESSVLETGLPVLGYLDDDLEQEIDRSSATVDCGIGNRAGNYLGAEGAVGLLKAIVRKSRNGQVDVLCHLDNQAEAARLRLTGGQQGAAIIEDRQADSVPVRTEEARIPSAFFDEENWANGQPLELQRYAASLAPVKAEIIRDREPFIAPDTCIVTDRPELAAVYANQASIVLSLSPVPAPARNVHYLAELSEETVSKLLQQLERKPSHIRVLSNLSLSAPVSDCLHQEPKSLVRLHDLTFLALKCCFDRMQQGNSSLVALFLEALPFGQLHPYSGLFSGLIKSAALELPDSRIYAVYSDANGIESAVRQAEEESRLKQLLPIAVYANGQRKTPIVEPIPGILPQDGLSSISSESLVVATAGARGITAELMKAVARHFRPHMVIIGRNKLDGYPKETFEGTDEVFGARRKAYLSEQKLLHKAKSIGQLNKEFDRLLEARQTYRNIREMEQLCGEGKVRYLACDVLDRQALAEAFEEIQRIYKRPIDLLVNAAGLNRSAATPAKQLSDFQAIRDIKIQGYLNLKHVLMGKPPGMWCNFGSFIGLTGQLGETDYAAANNFLSTAAAYVRQTEGTDEFTIGWTLWKSVGLGANPLTKAFLEKSALFTSMGTEEGIHHFIREISMATRDAATFHLGDAEKNAITRVIPNFFEACSQAAQSQRTGGAEGSTAAAACVERGTFYLGQEKSRTAKEVHFERIFDLDKDAYLQHHVVNGHATLPGTFVPELAAEAAKSLLPELHVIAFEDVVFHHFLRVYDASKPAKKKIQAKVLHRGSNQTLIQVKIMTDLVSPSGIMLQRDKLHFEAKVVMSSEVPAAPYWKHWDHAGELYLPDPYHFEKAPVLLTDMFVSTANTRQHPLGKRAVYRLGVDHDDPIFSSFLVPSIMLDGLARVAVLGLVEGDYLPLAAPASIRRIDLYESKSDCALAKEYAGIDLYATPRHIDLESDGSNRFVAVKPDGGILLQMHDVAGTVLGYVHQTTGEFVSLQEMDLLRQTRARLVMTR
ncbi:3-phenylpropionate-dihydrodiol/cinnamic acid-dihydrodiol dehydrogenase [Paenibacillus plantiphilus]|uniref:3-phenylpropionate-dihydrodiol/cinnamic acid-dihydrodiol dehydrogenase n=1 Tax=Paenibacillus plantiphilus TaxID=2905650 RepID=A0ABN8GEV2_9BACL|nr:SDR family oxidoreductase [Paenibacillus plantiphilus]CAH1201500.1 3-phenylpropionate-dihydrodiol/cinnamic acid-dihydrodiol dehydrogenase [Paenibacillus plantiphilus]